MSNAMSLKARIRNIARQKKIPAQVVLQNYMFERLLVRLSASPCKDKFVLKGGMLVAAMVGLDNRATMDLDTTLKNLPLTPDAIRSALEQICAVPSGDTVNFEVGAISPIREDDAYGGYRVALTARFETLAVPLSIDVSTGDAITPMRYPTALPRSLTKKRVTSCGPITWRPFWRKRWRPSCGAVCSIPAREIFMTLTYWRLRSPSTGPCSRRLCVRPPGTGAPQSRSRMCRAFCVRSGRARSCAPCGTNTRSSSVMHRISPMSRSWMWCKI